jgi:ZIP family zinc transporter
LAAAFWGFVGGSSLLVGVLVGLYVRTSHRAIAVIMAFGSGVLISSVAFELMDEAYRVGGFDAASVGLLLGAVAFFAADVAVASRGGGDRKRSRGPREDASATAIAIGALMDGIPESAAIGISLIEGETVSLVVVIAVFLSNFPEALSSAAGMRQKGQSPTYVLGVWGAVTLASTVAALLGYLFLAEAPKNIIGAIQAFAAGAILTMLASTMMPEAYKEASRFRGSWTKALVGVVTSVGFLLAFVLSRLE